MQITGMLHGARLLEFVGFPATEVLGPGRQRRGDQGADRPPRLGLHQAGVQGRRRQEGQGRPARPRERPEDRAGREGAAVFRRAPARQRQTPRPTA